MSKPTNDGAACTQRLACITFEKTPTTPLAPCGTARGELVHQPVGVDPASGRALAPRRRRTRRGTSASRGRVEADALHHPVAVGARGRACAAAPSGRSPGVSSTTVCCQNVPPTTVTLPGSVTPIPTSPSCVSAPPTTTGVACREAGLGRRRRGHLAPITVPGASHRREDRRVEAADLDHLVRPGARGEVEHPRARAERRVGDELAREPREDPVAEHADVRGGGEHLGLVRGDPQEAGGRGDRDPVAGAPVDPLGVARLDQPPAPRPRRASRRSGTPTARARRRPTAPCPRACWWR